MKFLLSTFFFTLSILVTGAGFTVNAGQNNQQEESHMKSITDELKDMAQNLKEYSKAKSKTYQEKLHDLTQKTRSKIDHLRHDLRESLIHRYDQAKAQYDTLINKGEEKEEEAYKNLLRNLEDLNDEIERSTEREKEK